jgi:hypothetical protein
MANINIHITAKKNEPIETSEIYKNILQEQTIKLLIPFFCILIYVPHVRHITRTVHSYTQQRNVLYISYDRTSLNNITLYANFSLICLKIQLREWMNVDIRIEIYVYAYINI